MTVWARIESGEYGDLEAFYGVYASAEAAKAAYEADAERPIVWEWRESKYGNYWYTGDGGYSSGQCMVREVEVQG